MKMEATSQNSIMLLCCFLVLGTPTEGTMSGLVCDKADVEIKVIGLKHGLNSHIYRQVAARVRSECKEACLLAYPACKAVTHDGQNNKCLLHSKTKDETNAGDYKAHGLKTYMEPACSAPARTTALTVVPETTTFAAVDKPTTFATSATETTVDAMTTTEIATSAVATQETTASAWVTTVTSESPSQSSPRRGATFMTRPAPIPATQNGSLTAIDIVYLGCWKISSEEGIRFSRGLWMNYTSKFNTSTDDPITACAALAMSLGYPSFSLVRPTANCHGISSMSVLFDASDDCEDGLPTQTKSFALYALQTECPKDWTRIGHTCYNSFNSGIVPAPLSLKDAQEACASHNASLIYPLVAWIKSVANWTSVYPQEWWTGLPDNTTGSGATPNYAIKFYAPAAGGVTEKLIPGLDPAKLLPYICETGDAYLGQWSDWTPWTSCTRGYDGGTKLRRRYKVAAGGSTEREEEVTKCNEGQALWGPGPFFGNSSSPYQWAGCWTANRHDDILLQLGFISLEDDRTILDMVYDARLASVEKCCLLGYSLGYTIVALRNRQCFGMNTTLKNQTMSYQTGGPSPGCHNGEGRADAIDVYINASTLVKAEWSAWSPYSSCTAACAGGVTNRTRTCANPPPPVAGVGECNGTKTEDKVCNTFSCPNDFEYKQIGCFKNHNSGAIQKATCLHLDGKDALRNDPISKCAFCAHIVGTPIFAVDKNKVCYAAKGNECSFDVYGKVAGSSSECDHSLSASHVTAYVLGSKFVQMHGYGIEIESSIVCPERGPVVPLPTGSLPNLSAEKATGLLRLTVSEANMKKLPEPQVKKIRQFLADLAEKTVFTSTISHTSEFLSAYMRATYNLLSTGYFQNSHSRESNIAASEVQETLETFMGRAAESLQTNAVFGMQVGDLAVEVSSQSAFEVMKKGARLPRIQKLLDEECLLPPSYFKELRGTAIDGSENERPTFEPQYVSFVAISISKEALNLPLQLEVEVSNDTTVTMKTNVVTFSTSLKTPHDVAQPVVVVLEHAIPGSNDSKKNDSYKIETDCVFWNYSLSPETGGAWSTNGCRLNSTNGTHTICHCNHLTSFAVLMKFIPSESEETMLVLDIVTYVGICVSILSLLATFGVFLYLNDILHSERTTIHKNLMVAIGLGQLVFITGINVTNDKITCTVIAVLLHLFFLASFMWMLAEGIHLYAKVIYVFTGGRNLLPLFYTIGWGLPIVVVTISAGIRIDGYGTKDYCWLSLEDGLVWAFIGPALCVIAINLMILVLVVRIVIVAAGTIPQTQDPKLIRQAWSAIKGIVILTPILGLSWLFGFVALNRDLLVFEFLFTFCNAFQGLFIFLFHCVGNSEVRSAFKRKREQSSLSKELQSVRISTPITGTCKSNKMAIPIIVMSQYEGSKAKLGSCGSFRSTGSRAKVAPTSPEDGRTNQNGNVTPLSIVDCVTCPKKVNITIDQQPYTEIEDDFESFDSIGVSTSSVGSLSKSIGHAEEDGKLTEVECPSRYIVRKSKNTHLPNLPFKTKPILYKRKQKDRY